MAPAGAQSPEPAHSKEDLTTIRIITFTRYPPMEIADELGFFADEGLAVTIENTPSSTAQMQGLAAGQWDVAITAFDNLLASTEREGTQSLALGSVSSPVIGLFARPETASFDDLRGKPIAVDAPNTAFALVLRRILLEHGLDLEQGDYELIPVGGTQERLTSMEAGETYAGIMTPPWDDRAAQAGMVKLADYADVLPEYPGNVIAVTQPWLSQPGNRAAAVRFMRAWLRAANWALDPTNFDQGVAILMRRQGITQPAAETLLGTVLADSAPNVAGYRTVLDLRLSFGLTPRPGPALERFYDPSIFAAATAPPSPGTK